MCYVIPRKQWPCPDKTKVIADWDNTPFNKQFSFVTQLLVYISIFLSRADADVPIYMYGAIGNEQ